MGNEAERTFESLWRRHHQRVHAYALRRSEASTAQDVVSETFLVAWRRRDEMPRRELAWLLGVARGVLANDARGQRRRDALARTLIETSARWHEDPGSVDRSLLHALAALPEHEREALILVAWDGLSTREAAAAAGCSPSALRVRLLRARRRLRGELSRTEEPMPVTASAREHAS